MVLLQPRDIGAQGRSSGFNSAVVAIDKCGSCRRAGLRIVEETPHIVMQRALVALQRQDVITARAAIPKIHTFNAGQG